jgi:hypothetical protein
MKGELLMENVGEVCGHVFDDSGEKGEEFFGGELHDFAVEVNDPYDLFFFGQHLFTDVEESLVEVTDHGVFVDDLVHFVHFD